jgi:hypothetical protein
MCVGCPAGDSSAEQRALQLTQSDNKFCSIATVHTHISRGIASMTGATTVVRVSQCMPGCFCFTAGCWDERLLRPSLWLQ